MVLVFLVLVGLLIGLISGTLGIGGGVLLVPILTWVFHYGQAKAQGITLAVLVLPVVLPATWQYFRSGVIGTDDLVTAGFIALGFAGGGFIGASYVRHIHEDVLRFLFGLALIYIGVRFLLASDNEFANAFFGLLAMTASCLAYFGLRALGRKHLRKPDLGDSIRAFAQRHPGESDYHI